MEKFDARGLSAKKTIKPPRNTREAGKLRTKVQATILSENNLTDSVGNFLRSIGSVPVEPQHRNIAALISCSPEELATGGW